MPATGPVPVRIGETTRWDDTSRHLESPQTKIARRRPLGWTTGGEETVAATLAESLAAGDPEAFAALYDRLAVRLLGAARTMTDSTAEAEDVVQDLFVELARGRCPPGKRHRSRGLRVHDAAKRRPRKGASHQIWRSWED
jgi:hypothetical protein